MNAAADHQDETKLMGPMARVGQSLKHFRLDAVLGTGGMGVVYRGYDTQLHRPVAVKLLSAEVTEDPVRRQRFFLEARAAARISHPTIAQIYYVDEASGVAFIVMELVEGKTVRQLIEEQQLDLLGAIDIAIQVADGLAKAHEQGIVHRDIKPANVMLTADGHVKILDFGLAKRLDPDPMGAATTSAAGRDLTLISQTQSGVLLGTPAYMSPEQVRGTPLDARSDLFSLGVLIFEMATGQSPFRRTNYMDSLHAVAFDETPSMNSLHGPIPAELQRIVSRCLRKQADERYLNARALATDLRALRRNTEAGRIQQTNWQQRINEAWERLRTLPPSRYGWFALVVAGLGFGLYLSLARIGIGGMVLAVMVGLFFYRHIKHRRLRLQESFVRKVARLPEVRLLTLENQHWTVVVDRPVAQLYSRINQQLMACNQKLYGGNPMTVSILHDTTPEQVQKMLSGPGVHHVRHDVTDPPASHQTPSPKQIS